MCQSVRDGLDRQADEQTGQIMKQETEGGGGGMQTEHCGTSQLAFGQV